MKQTAIYYFNPARSGQRHQGKIHLALVLGEEERKRFDEAFSQGIPGIGVTDVLRKLDLSDRKMGVRLLRGYVEPLDKVVRHLEKKLGIECLLDNTDLPSVEGLLNAHSDIKKDKLCVHRDMSQRAELVRGHLLYVAFRSDNPQAASCFFNACKMTQPRVRPPWVSKDNSTVITRAYKTGYLEVQRIMEESGFPVDIKEVHLETLQLLEGLLVVESIAPKKKRAA